MRRIIVLCLLVLISLNLTGCGYLTGRTQEMIDNYNNRLESTLITYENLKLLAEKEKANLYSFILGETKEFHSIEILDLTEIDISSSTHLVIRDEYFTSLDSTVLKEVLILIGKSKSVIYVEVVWGADGVISITRRGV